MKSGLFDRIALGGALLLFPVLAFGYIDSGTGSILVQAAVSGLLGLAFVARNLWSNLVRPRRIQSTETAED